jgi:DNA modification methylase/transcriptional regulator with XRE-family HTH domain
MTGEAFLDERVTLFCGDSRDVLKSIASASVDAVITDPPYALVSVVKRFGGPNAAPQQHGVDGLYARAAAGFMGKQWDTGETAFAAGFWAEVLRVLKPGGHVAAFSGTRTYHRMTCAIEDAGFEIRDQLAWVYGSGFPKSHDVSKAIDKRRDWAALTDLQAAIRLARQTLGLSQSEAARRMGLVAAGERLGGGGFMWFETGMRLPTREQWPELKRVLKLGDEFDGAFEAAEREVVGQHDSVAQAAQWRAAYQGGDVPEPGQITRAVNETAKAWEGWGTALKPAWEPICLGRKPLIGTVAENVLAHGTGAINIDACRIGTDGGSVTIRGDEASTTVHAYGDGLGAQGGEILRPFGLGRFPANILHDGSDEVVAAFPTEAGGGNGAHKFTSGIGGNGVLGGGSSGTLTLNYADTGTAARFFYSAKADAEDRIGSKHPTVKPVDLMQWLIRLLTPKGGLVLDPFAGSGTTGEAAWREGCRAYLVEREAEYQADIRRRLELAAAGPRERQQAAAKGPREHGDLPLFGGAKA